MLACHNYWHWALYLIEKVRRPAVLSCEHVQRKKNFSALATLRSLCSLTFRVRTCKRCLGARWHRAFEERFGLKRPQALSTVRTRRSPGLCAVCGADFHPVFLLLGRLVEPPPRRPCHVLSAAEALLLLARGSAVPGAECHGSMPGPAPGRRPAPACCGVRREGALHRARFQLIPRCCISLSPDSNDGNFIFPGRV